MEDKLLPIILPGYALGRVGPITILVVLAARQRPPLYKLPEEDIAIG
jgi:hypothetical protein